MFFDSFFDSNTLTKILYWVLDELAKKVINGKGYNQWYFIILLGILIQYAYFLVAMNDNIKNQISKSIGARGPFAFDAKQTHLNS